MKLKGLLSLSVVLSGLAAVASATPSVSGVSGTPGTGQTIQISGSGFGTKSPAAPYVWADFESGINPTSLGQKTTWDSVQSMTWASGQGYNGGGAATSSDSSGDWAMRTDWPNWTQDGQKSYIYKRLKQNFLITDPSQNWKIYRAWASSQHPDIYAAANNGRAYTEFVEDAGIDSGFWGNFNNNTTAWHTEEILMKASTINQKDGSLEFRVNNASKASGAILTRSSGSPDYMTQNYAVHCVLANASQWSPAWSSSNKVWADDVYVDYSWAHVMIGDAATFSACTTLDIQIPSSWSDGSVTVMSHTPSFSSGTHAYLYVFDPNGNVNASGYPITIGAGSAPTNTAPTVSAGNDVTVTLGAAITLNGSASDDGLPNNSLSTTWSYVSGPAGSSFSNASAATTGVTVTAAGTYVFKLTASDGSLSSSDQVTVTVNAVQPVNQAPTANAGPDATVTVNQSLALTGQVTDDGLPNPPAATTVRWSSVAGPSTPTVTDSASLSTNATFPVAGRYVLRLTASDGALSATDDVVVTANAVSQTNFAPTADAGADQVVVLPGQANLAATATDDGLPNNQLTYAWGKVSGPGTVAFGDTTSPTTWASFSTAGLYVLAVTVSDGQLSTSDQISIDVRPETQAGVVPTVAGLSGRLITGQQLQVVGSGFGTKSPAAPLVYADFEDGLDPSALGQIHSWSAVQNMQWSTTDGYAGSKAAMAADGNGTWTLRVDQPSWTQDSERIYVHRRTRMNFVITSASQDWKIWRMWANNFGYPDIYAESSSGNVNVENLGTPGGFTGDFKQATTNWSTEEILMQASSAADKKDGLFVLRYDGVEKARGAIMTKSSTAPSPMAWNYVVHGVAANKASWSPAWSTDNRLWVDDVYVDNTWARVMLGDAPTFATCHKLDIQVPTSWSDGAITFVARTASFAKHDNAYLYVIDRNGNPNVNGFPVRIDAQHFGSLVDGGNAPSDSVDETARNVFNPTRGEHASLPYALNGPGSVKVLIYDRGGRRVKELVGDEVLEGTHTISWDGRNDDGSLVASGIYVAVAKGSDGSHSKTKVAVIK